MKRIAAVVFLTAGLTTGLSGSVWADACADLVDQAQAGLGMSNVDDAARSQLLQLLETGKSGDVSQCEAALTASMPHSSPAAGPGGHGCSRKSPDTV